MLSPSPEDIVLFIVTFLLILLGWRVFVLWSEVDSINERLRKLEGKGNIDER